MVRVQIYVPLVFQGILQVEVHVFRSKIQDHLNVQIQGVHLVHVHVEHSIEPHILLEILSYPVEIRTSVKMVKSLLHSHFLNPHLSQHLHFMMRVKVGCDGIGHVTMKYVMPVSRDILRVEALVFQMNSLIQIIPVVLLTNKPSHVEIFETVSEKKPYVKPAVEFPLLIQNQMK